MSGAQRIEAVIFDLDGVLVDSEPVHHRAMGRLIAPLEVTEEEYALFVGASLEWTIDWLRRRFALIEATDVLAMQYDDLVTEQLLQEPPPPLDGAVELLEELRGRGVRLAVASQSRPRWVRATLDGSGLRRHFDEVVTADEVARAKPAPDVYLHAADRLGVQAGACLVVEDSVPGVASARAAGMFVVQTQQASSAVERQPGADAVVVSLRAFRLDWLG
ncbi:MAG: HAD family phosphatase [Dehalococcoidia bacterium]